MRSQQPSHTPAYQTPDLTTCDREPIHVPGAIQPHGVLLAIGADERIEVASANTAAMIGVDSSALLGRPLTDVLGEATRLVREAIDQQEPVTARRAVLPTGGLLGSREVDVLVHTSADRTVVELEPVPAVGGSVSHRAARAAVTRLTQADTVGGLCDQLAIEIRALTGFDRVMVYRFDEQWNGEVVSEQRREDLNAFLGLHYPATDIPAQARRLYTENWTRLIADVAYTPVPLDPVFDPHTGLPLDLSHSTLRSVSPIHIEYLSNMDVTASMSVSMVRAGQLWGLVACHHYSGPHHVPFDVRNAAEFLGQSASHMIGDRVRTADQSAELRAMQVLSDLMEDISETSGSVHDRLIADPLMTEIVGARGAAAWVDGRLMTTGAVPPADVLHRIVELLHREDGAAAATDHLAGLDPELAEYADTAAGALVVSTGDERWKVWVRPAQVHTVDWGGDPHNKELAAREGADVRLSPRKSFERWRQVVSDRSEPWAPWHLVVADELRSRISHELVRRTRDHLALAESLQRALVLDDAPRIEGFDALARYRPAADIQLGGDWWDVFDLPDGRTAVVVGDVSGHGVQAATAMAQIRTCVRAYALDGHAPGPVLDRLDQFVDLTMPGRTATVVFAALDRRTGEIEVANAGHPSPLLIGAGGIRVLAPAGRPLIGAGVGTARSDRLTMAPDDVLLVFTDGVFERRDEPADESLRRLLRTVDEHDHGGELISLLDRIFAAETGTLDDDLTVVAVRRAATDA